MAALDDSEFRPAVLDELVLPALDRIVKSFEGTGNVYTSLIRALWLVLNPAGDAPSRRLRHRLPVLEPDGSLSRG